MRCLIAGTRSSRWRSLTSSRTKDTRGRRWAAVPIIAGRVHPFTLLSAVVPPVDYRIRFLPPRAPGAHVAQCVPLVDHHRAVGGPSLRVQGVDSSVEYGTSPKMEFVVLLAQG